jgi:hypothetical protein
MDYKFLLMLLFPMIWLIGAKWFLRTTINWTEFAIAVLVVVGMSAIFYYTGKYSVTADTLVLNGKVTKKYERTESCPVGWKDYHDDFCREYNTRVVPDGIKCTGTGQNRSCHMTYKTQYKYIYPWERNWYVQDSFAVHEIRRVDDQGAQMPQRWNIAYVGEPASAQEDYTNYVKAVPESLFNGTKGAKYVTSIPAHPLVFDYYRTSHAMNYKSAISAAELQKINLEIGNILREDGYMYQANVIAVVTDVNDPDIRYAFEKSWVGGKKNDIIVFIGRNPSGGIQWADVMTWAHNYHNETLQVELRDAILAMPTIEATSLASIVHTNIKKNYKRPEMKDFEYLKARIQPPTWVLWVVGFICFAFPIGFTFLFHYKEVDIFNNSGL